MPVYIDTIFTLLLWWLIFLLPFIFVHVPIEEHKGHIADDRTFSICFPVARVVSWGMLGQTFNMYIMICLSPLTTTGTFQRKVSANCQQIGATKNPESLFVWYWKQQLFVWDSTSWVQNIRNVKLPLPEKVNFLHSKHMIHILSAAIAQKTDEVHWLWGAVYLPEPDN